MTQFRITAPCLPVLICFEPSLAEKQKKSSQFTVFTYFTPVHPSLNCKYSSANPTRHALLADHNLTWYLRAHGSVIGNCKASFLVVLTFTVLDVL